MLSLFTVFILSLLSKAFTTFAATVAPNDDTLFEQVVKVEVKDLTSTRDVWHEFCKLVDETPFLKNYFKTYTSNRSYTKTFMQRVQKQLRNRLEPINENVFDEKVGVDNLHSLGDLFNQMKRITWLLYDCEEIQEPCIVSMSADKGAPLDKLNSFREPGSDELYNHLYSLGKSMKSEYSFHGSIDYQENVQNGLLTVVCEKKQQHLAFEKFITGMKGRKRNKLDQILFKFAKLVSFNFGADQKDGPERIIHFVFLSKNLADSIIFSKPSKPLVLLSPLNLAIILLVTAITLGGMAFLLHTQVHSKIGMRNESTDESNISSNFKN